MLPCGTTMKVSSKWTFYFTPIFNQHMRAFKGSRRWRLNLTKNFHKRGVSLVFHIVAGDKYQRVHEGAQNRGNPSSWCAGPQAPARWKVPLLVNINGLLNAINWNWGIPVEICIVKRNWCLNYWRNIKNWFMLTLIFRKNALNILGGGSIVRAMSVSSFLQILDSPVSPLKSCAGRLVWLSTLQNFIGS